MQSVHVTAYKAALC